MLRQKDRAALMRKPLRCKIDRNAIDKIRSRSMMPSFHEGRMP